MSETYHINVYKKIPFKWVMRKKGHYNRSGIEIADTNTLGTLVPYVGSPYTPLSTTYTLETGYPLVINIGSGELPDYNYTSSFAGTLKSLGQIDSVPRTFYTNYNRVGTIDADIDTGIVSGFSSNKYITIPGIDLTTADTWEVVAKFKINTLGKYQFWWYSPGAWGLDDLNRMHYWSVPGGSDVYSTYTFVENTWYWVKMEFTGTTYNWYYKTSVDNPWTLIMSANSTTKISSVPSLTNIGINPNITSEYFYGDIDLSEYYVKADGVVIWSSSQLDIKLYDNYNKAGAVSTNIATGLVSGFSASNYLSLPSAFSPNGSTWEYYIKFTTGSDVSTSQGLTSALGTSNGCTPFYVDTGNLACFLSSNGSSWDIALKETVMAVATNTTYKMKAEFTGTAYNWYLWQNDDWSLVKTISSSTATYDGLTMILGSNRGQNNPFLGTIDLSETYIKINGSIWWSPESYQELFYAKGLLPTGVTDDGSAQTWNLFYNDGEFVADIIDIKSGYSWCGSITVPAHSI